MAEGCHEASRRAPPRGDAGLSYQRDDRALPRSVIDPHALILTSSPRENEVARALLAEIGIAAKLPADVATFARMLADNVLFAVIAEEALRDVDLDAFARWTHEQPSWSDLNFLLLTRHGGGLERNPLAERLSEALGNVTFIERPFHPTTFASVARTALKARNRQYEGRSAMEKLAETGERLATALIAGRLSAWELDLDTMDLTVTDDLRAVYGYAPEQHFDYEVLLACIHPEDRGRVVEAMLRVADGADVAVEYRTSWPNGEPHWAETRARLVRTRGRRKLVGVCSNVTERKVAESALRSANETLEAHVAARTAELEAAHRMALDQITQREAAERRLRQSQKMEMIGQLTGGVAHDFNNLLMAVLGNLDVLRRHVGEDPKARRLIDGAIQGAQRGASLTQRLLAFARRQDLSIAATDLCELVRGMVSLIERTIGRTIELRVELPEAPAWAEVDANQVELALLNLVVNARDAMPDGGVLTVSMDVGPGPEGVEGRFTRLAVADSGTGMDKATLDRATEPFFTTKGVGKGTGLGLSMILGLTRQLGGELRLSSAEGAGTLVELFFPVAEAAARAPAPEVAAPPAPAEPRRLRILVVDDDALIAMSSVDMLEDLGHEVLEANSGEAALRLLRDDAGVDLMITDFSMPRMNGAQLAQAARALRPELPIILATGYAELPPGAEIDLPRLGKPYDQRQLETQIDALRLGARP
ncbi:MAG: hybrid sensor histidine kinase/response regulator [Rhodovulum sulfidophilum]|uniref:histidine kinase n=1 Tax=Rhodovulum sulfidophilum TaxID=35806 RepID=A0A2W5NA25_RHOSU|nr:MAG: hybrid sensor histidine kinase/response regulator [Rhodovulum sulfidophilum]